MSQVNDALKRASNSDKNRPRPPETQGRLKSVASSGPSPLAVALAFGVVLALVLAGWFFWHWWKAKHSSASANRAPVTIVAPAPPPPAGVEEPVSQASASAPGSPPSRRTVEEAWPADLKLTGIFFSKTRPMALINGETVGVGEFIGGIRIAKIEQDRISVEWHGQVKELILK
jgi:hypothetical protein